MEKVKTEKVNLDGLPIGQVVKKLRESQRYSQVKIADAVDVSRNRICEIEKGKGFPSYSLLRDILFFLGYEISVRQIKKYAQEKGKKKKKKNKKSKK